MTLSQLLHECRKGNTTAQKKLYDFYVVQMFLLCRRYLKDDCTAEECMLTGFLKCFQSISKFRYKDDNTTTAWLKKIMVNECLQYLRQARSFVMTVESEALDVAVDEEAISTMSADEIYKLIVQLPVGYRTVFNLYAIEGMTHREIAEVLSIKEGTSKSQLSKAKQMLQQLLITNDAVYAERRAK